MQTDVPKAGEFKSICWQLKLGVHNLDGCFTVIIRKLEKKLILLIEFFSTFFILLLDVIIFNSVTYHTFLPSRMATKLRQMDEKGQGIQEFSAVKVYSKTTHLPFGMSVPSLLKRINWTVTPLVYCYWRSCLILLCFCLFQLFFV